MGLFIRIPNFKTLRPELANFTSIKLATHSADLCIALQRSLATSKGTKDCVRQALAARIPVYLV